MVKSKLKRVQPKKLPEDPRRKKQVSTFLKRYGRSGYQQAGRKGSEHSPTKFDSERGRQAAIISWEKRRAKAAGEENDHVEQSQI